jgi:hypothetical protein
MFPIKFSHSNPTFLCWVTIVLPVNVTQRRTWVIFVNVYLFESTNLAFTLKGNENCRKGKQQPDWDSKQAPPDCSLEFCLYTNLPSPPSVNPSFRSWKHSLQWLNLLSSVERFAVVPWMCFSVLSQSLRRKIYNTFVFAILKPETRVPQSVRSRRILWNMHLQWTFRLHRSRIISSLTEWLLVSQGEHCSMELITNIMSRVGVTYKTGVWIGFITPYTHNSGLQAIQSYCWSTHFAVHRCTTH